MKKIFGTLWYLKESYLYNLCICGWDTYHTSCVPYISMDDHTCVM